MYLQFDINIIKLSLEVSNSERSGYLFLRNFVSGVETHTLHSNSLTPAPRIFKINASLDSHKNSVATSKFMIDTCGHLIDLSHINPFPPGSIKVEIDPFGSYQDVLFFLHFHCARQMDTQLSFPLDRSF